MRDVVPITGHRDWLHASSQPVVQAPDQAAGPRSLTLLHFDEDAAPYLDDAWLIDDVLPERGLCVLFGAPGSRKTFTAIDLALHIASGLPTWRGHRIEPRAVMYLALEGGKAFRNRLAAWRTHHGCEASHFFRCPERLDLRSSDADGDRVVRAGRRVTADTGVPLGLVVVDTLARAMCGGNENGVEDMGAFIAICDSIARELDCLVLVLHHSGKDAAKGSRGHSSLLGAVDTEMSLADGVLTITKQRDGRDGMRIGIELAEIDLGVTPKGKRVTSCVALQGEITREAKLTSGQRETLDAIREYVIDHGKPNPGGTGWPEPGTRKIAGRDDVVAFLSGKQPTADRKEAKKQAEKKLDRLKGAGIIAQNGGFVWLCT